MRPPSTEAYNLAGETSDPSMGQSKAIMEILGDKVCIDRVAQVSKLPLSDATSNRSEKCLLLHCNSSFSKNLIICEDSI